MTSNANLQPHESTSKAQFQPKISTSKGKIEFFASKITQDPTFFESINYKKVFKLVLA